MKLRIRSLALVGAFMATLLLGACSDDVGSGISTTEGGDRTTTTAEEVATTTTAAPTTTTTGAPETTTTSGTGTTTAADSGEAGEESNTGLFIVLGIILLVVVIIAINASRRSNRAGAAAAGTAVAADTAPPWKATADQAYSQARWLYENLTPEIGQWRGDSLHAGADSGGEQTSGGASAHQQTWDQLGTQMTAATNTLYSLEPQVSPSSQPVVRSVIDNLNRTRTAVDDVASARLALDQATDALQADSGNQRLQQDLAAAHDHENQSVQTLNGSRTVLQGALANLAALR
jgi:hypothetical protein